MQVINFTSEELKHAIDSGEVVSRSGNFSVLFLYENQLIKLDKPLFEQLKINSIQIAPEIVSDCQKENGNFVSEEQIEYLLSKQPDIKLTDFDLGVVKVGDYVCGTILANHLTYQDLTNIKGDNPEYIYKLLVKTFLALCELEDNGISLLDISLNDKNADCNLNILYKDLDIKLCDLEGEYLTYGDKFDSQAMYKDFFVAILFLIRKIAKLNPYYQLLFHDIKGNIPTTREEISSLLKRINDFIKNGISLFGYQENEVAYQEEKLSNHIKVYLSSLKINSPLDSLSLPSDLLLNYLIVENNEIIDKAKFPKRVEGFIELRNTKSLTYTKLPEYVGNDLILSNVVELHHVTFPNVVMQNLYLSSLPLLENVRFPSCVNGSIDLGQALEIRNSVLTENMKGTLDLRNLIKITNSTLPKSLISLLLTSIESLKGVLLPEDVKGKLAIRDLSVLEGALISENVKNYVISIYENGYNYRPSTENYYLYDLIDRYHMIRVNSLEDTTNKTMN